MVESGALSGLKEQGKAILLFLGIAILAVLGIIILEEFRPSFGSLDGDNTTANHGVVNSTLDTFIAAMVIFGTFASVIALIIVVKAVISVVRGLQ